MIFFSFLHWKNNLKIFFRGLPGSQVMGRKCRRQISLKKWFLFCNVSYKTLKPNLLWCGTGSIVEAQPWKMSEVYVCFIWTHLSWTKLHKSCRHGSRIVCFMQVRHWQRSPRKHHTVSKGDLFGIWVMLGLILAQISVSTSFTLANLHSRLTFFNHSYLWFTSTTTWVVITNQSIYTTI